MPQYYGIVINCSDSVWSQVTTCFATTAHTSTATVAIDNPILLSRGGGWDKEGGKQARGL